MTQHERRTLKVRNLRRLGIVGFAFFFLKGMVWLAAGAIAIFGTSTL